MTCRLTAHANRLTSPVTKVVSACVDDVANWMLSNRMQLSNSKARASLGRFTTRPRAARGLRPRIDMLIQGCIGTRAAIMHILLANCTRTARGLPVGSPRIARGKAVGLATCNTTPRMPAYI